ncbi:hypothetical protein U0035_16670 [Niabella yanshanensis]|uniref:Uncharacterized protein n=1 Tax=Niabella yanshanensis TaxID=577386 RepID=A0ABZ0W3U9_9BACT|nr:hypothetical protein [Niabella yanshanensis]WQD37303.1 hypothetical protein U0035_16670 [Niabella yanshanensis]
MAAKFYGARFLPVFAPSEDGRTTVLKVQKLNHHEKLEEAHVAAIFEKIKLDQGKNEEAVREHSYRNFLNKKPPLQ